MSTLDECRKASEHLYDALSHLLNGDSCLMDGIWSHSMDVTTMHPVGGREVGWKQVQERWDQLARLTSDGQIRLKDQLIRIEGDLAFEVGIEEGQVRLGGRQVAIQQRATNIYRLEAGVWKAVHHHADFSPAMADALRSLEPKE